MRAPLLHPLDLPAAHPLGVGDHVGPDYPILAKTNRNLRVAQMNGGVRCVLP